MNTSKNKKKVEMITYSNKNIGFSLSIPDNWMEVKKSSYPELGINENTLFIFAVDKFTTITAVFGGYCGNDFFDDAFKKLTSDNLKILYKDTDKLENIMVRQIVVEKNNKKILNNFCLVNGMLINFTINLSNKIKGNSKKEITNDPSFKIIKEMLKSLTISIPVNPPVYIESNHKVEVPIYTKTTNVIVPDDKITKKPAQLLVEKECRYRNILRPSFFFKYICKKDCLSVINNEIYSNIDNLTEENKDLVLKIKKLVSNRWSDLNKYDLHIESEISKSHLVIKLDEEYILVNINEQTKDIVDSLIKDINELINKNKIKTNNAEIDEENKGEIKEEKVIIPIINGKQHVNEVEVKTIDEPKEEAITTDDNNIEEVPVESENQVEESPIEYDLSDFQDYFHNIDGHASFRFLFPSNSGELVIRDFNVFDVVNDDGLEYRVFIFKCENEEKYQEKLNDWMSKNISSSGFDIVEEYESKSNNGLNIKTFILSNDKFYKVTYVFGYLIAVSSYNDQDKLSYAEIALDNVQVGEDSKEFIESYNRKLNSINILKAQGIPYIDELPVIQSSYEVAGKTLEEIAKRAIVLCICCNYSNDIVANKKKKYLKDSKKFFTKLLDKYNVNDVMTKEEKELFEKDDKNLAVQISWQFEGLSILLWTLGLIDDISFPDTLVDTDSLTAIISSCDSYSEFISKCSLRNIYEILDLADLTYRYNWYCVDARINSEEPIINPEVVMERHRALKWLLTDEKWDKVAINT